MKKLIFIFAVSNLFAAFSFAQASLGPADLASTYFERVKQIDPQLEATLQNNRSGLQLEDTREKAILERKLKQLSRGLTRTFGERPVQSEVEFLSVQYGIAISYIYVQTEDGSICGFYGITTGRVSDTEVTEMTNRNHCY